MPIIDLSVPIGEGWPCTWPGLPGFQRAPLLTLDSDGVWCEALRLDEHTGTHLDAPMHIADEDGQPSGPSSINDIPLDRLTGPAVVLDLRHVRGQKPGVSPSLTRDVLHATAGWADIGTGSAVLLQTGWSDRYYRRGEDGESYVQEVLAGSAPGWPSPDPEAISALAERGALLIGTDAPSIGAAHDPLPAHRAAIGASLTIVENLTGLAGVQKGDRFLFLPLALDTGSGSPGRAVAIRTPEG